MAACKSGRSRLGRKFRPRGERKAAEMISQTASSRGVGQLAWNAGQPGEAGVATSKPTFLPFRPLDGER